MLECKQSRMQQFFPNSRANNSGHSGPQNQTYTRSVDCIFLPSVVPIGQYLQVLCRVYTKANSSIFPNSRVNNSGNSSPIGPVIELIGDPMVIYIITKVQGFHYKMKQHSHLRKQQIRWGSRGLPRPHGSRTKPW